MTRVTPIAVVLGLAGCTFFDPLDQAGLRVIVTPPDTAVYVAASYRVVGLMVNSYGDQYPSDHITYAGLGPSVSVLADGIVTGRIYGRARIVAERGDLADTGWVSVVPTGTLAISGIDAATLDVVQTDGSGFVSIASTGQYGGGAPAWLPGNGGLVYQYAIPGGAGATDLYVADSLRSTRLLATSGRDPRTTRDGSWVYFANGGQIERVHVDGSGRQLVSSSMFGDYQPDPSPDGTQLAITRALNPDVTGFEIDLDSLATGAVHRLVASGLLPRWAPDGSRLAYMLGGALLVVNADGTGAHTVSGFGRTYGTQGLDWSPDGQWLVARSDSTLDLIQVSTSLTLPLSFGARYFLVSWKP